MTTIILYVAYSFVQAVLCARYDLFEYRYKSVGLVVTSAIFAPILSLFILIGVIHKVISLAIGENT